MKKLHPYHQSPRCSATSKRTRKPCQAPAVKGWTVCRFHGAYGGAPTGKRNGNYRNGLHTNDAIAQRRAVSQLIRRSTEVLRTLAKE